MVCYPQFIVSYNLTYLTSATLVGVGILYGLVSYSYFLTMLRKCPLSTMILTILILPDFVLHIEHPSDRHGQSPKLAAQFG